MEHSVHREHQTVTLHEHEHDSPGISSGSAAHNGQNPLHTFPRNFPVDREAANLLPTYWQQVFVGLMEFGKRHDTTDTTDFSRANYGLFTDLLVAGKLVYRNGFWPQLAPADAAISHHSSVERTIPYVYNTLSKEIATNTGSTLKSKKTSKNLLKL